MVESQKMWKSFQIYLFSGIQVLLNPPQDITVASCTDSLRGSSIYSAEPKASWKQVDVWSLHQFAVCGEIIEFTVQEVRKGFLRTGLKIAAVLEAIWTCLRRCCPVLNHVCFLIRPFPECFNQVW